MNCGCSFGQFQQSEIPILKQIASKILLDTSHLRKMLPQVFYFVSFSIIQLTSPDIKRLKT